MGTCLIQSFGISRAYVCQNNFIYSRASPIKVKRVSSCESYHVDRQLVALLVLVLSLGQFGLSWAAEAQKTIQLLVRILPRASLSLDRPRSPL